MSGHRHDSNSGTQNQGNSLGDRACVRQSKLYRQHESGNNVKDILGIGSENLRWDQNRQQGAYAGRAVYDHDNAVPSGYVDQNSYSKNAPNDSYGSGGGGGYGGGGGGAYQSRSSYSDHTAPAYASASGGGGGDHRRSSFDRASAINDMKQGFNLSHHDASSMAPQRDWSRESDSYKPNNSSGANYRTSGGTGTGPTSLREQMTSRAAVGGRNYVEAHQQDAYAAASQVVVARAPKPASSMGGQSLAQFQQSSADYQTSAPNAGRMSKSNSSTGFSAAMTQSGRTSMSDSHQPSYNYQNNIYGGYEEAAQRQAAYGGYNNIGAGASSSSRSKFANGYSNAPPSHGGGGVSLGQQLQMRGGGGGGNVPGLMSDSSSATRPW